RARLLQRHEEAAWAGPPTAARPGSVVARRTSRHPRRGRQGARRQPGDGGAGTRSHGADVVARRRTAHVATGRGGAAARRRARAPPDGAGQPRHGGRELNDAVAVFAIARKDLLQALRSKATAVATVFFSGMTLFLMAFALGRDESLLVNSAPGVLWVAVV